MRGKADFSCPAGFSVNSLLASSNTGGSRVAFAPYHFQAMPSNESSSLNRRTRLGQIEGTVFGEDWKNRGGVVARHFESS